MTFILLSEIDESDEFDPDDFDDADWGCGPDCDLCNGGDWSDGPAWGEDGYL